MIWRLILLASAVVGLASGCELNCKTQSPKRALKTSDIVFRGTVAEVTESEVIFTVERVWKGALPRIYKMPKVISPGPCLAGFSQREVQRGNDLVVYAIWWSPSSPVLDLFPRGSLPGFAVGLCSRTALARDATEDIKALGKGNPPQN